MLRTIFAVGVCALLGIVFIGVAFSLFGFAIGLVAFLVFLALKILILGAILYAILWVVSPNTARRLRARFSGNGW